MALRGVMWIEETEVLYSQNRGLRTHTQKITVVAGAMAETTVLAHLSQKEATLHQPPKCADVISMWLRRL